MAKFANQMDKIAEGAYEGYKKIEDGVVGGYNRCTERIRCEEASLLQPSESYAAAQSAYDRLWHQQPPDT